MASVDADGGDARPVSAVQSARKLSVAGNRTVFRLRVLSLNCWGLPFPGAKHVDARMQSIARGLGSGQWDLVCLQEVWMKRHQRLLVTTAQQCGLRYSYYFQCGMGFPLFAGQTGSGLLVVSRYPIVNVAYRSYPVNGKIYKFYHADYYACKGVGMVSIATPVGVIDAMNSHLVANYGGERTYFPPASFGRGSFARLAGRRVAGGEHDTYTTVGTDESSDGSAGGDTQCANSNGGGEGTKDKGMTLSSPSLQVQCQCGLGGRRSNANECTCVYVGGMPVVRPAEQHPAGTQEMKSAPTRQPSITPSSHLRQGMATDEYASHRVCQAWWLAQFLALRRLGSFASTDVSQRKKGDVQSVCLQQMQQLLQRESSFAPPAPVLQLICCDLNSLMDECVYQLVTRLSGCSDVLYCADVGKPHSPRHPTERLTVLDVHADSTQRKTSTGPSGKLLCRSICQCGCEDQPSSEFTTAAAGVDHVVDMIQVCACESTVTGAPCPPLHTHGGLENTYCDSDPSGAGFRLDYVFARGASGGGKEWFSARRGVYRSWVRHPHAASVWRSNGGGKAKQANTPFAAPPLSEFVPCSDHWGVWAEFECRAHGPSSPEDTKLMKPTRLSSSTPHSANGKKPKKKDTVASPPEFQASSVPGNMPWRSSKPTFHGQSPTSASRSLRGDAAAFQRTLELCAATLETGKRDADRRRRSHALRAGMWVLMAVGLLWYCISGNPTDEPPPTPPPLLAGSWVQLLHHGCMLVLSKMRSWILPASAILALAAFALCVLEVWMAAILVTDERLWLLEVYEQVRLHHFMLFGHGKLPAEGEADGGTGTSSTDDQKGSG